jgi:hypothetical protein
MQPSGSAGVANYENDEKSSLYIGLVTKRAACISQEVQTEAWLTRGTVSLIIWCLLGVYSQASQPLLQQAAPFSGFISGLLHESSSILPWQHVIGPRVGYCFMVGKLQGLARRG